MSKMEEKGIFRSAIGGFNKNDVLTYIDELTGGWNEERVQLTEAAETARQEAQQATAAANEATERAQAAVAEAEERLAAMAQKLEEVTQQLAEMTAQRDVAVTEKAALAEELQQEQEKTRTATAEMMAAEERLQTREQEIASLGKTLDEQQEQMARYAAVLGQSDGVQGHVDGIVRPFLEDANRRASDTLQSMHTLLDAMLTQMGELKTDVETQQATLQQRKAESDARLADTLDTWMDKARQLAQDTAGRVTRFFR